MSLQDILHEISNEDVEVKSAPRVSVYKTPQLDKSALHKFNTLYNLAIMKSSVASMKKVDLKLATEIFTMLPELNQSESAKLSSTPSVMNKEILEHILSSVSNNIPTQLVDTVKQVSSEIKELNADIVVVLGQLNNYVNIYTAQLLRLQSVKPIIIVDKNSINILNDELYSVCCIDDTKLDYKKYENNLSKKILAVVNNPELTNLLFIAQTNSKSNVREYSLYELTNTLIHYIHNTNSRSADLIKFTQEVDNNFTVENTLVNPETTVIINSLPNIIESLNNFKFVNAILNNNEVNFFDSLHELLEFL